MIEINLLPENLRKKREISVGVSWEAVRNAALVLLAVFILFQALLQLFIFIDIFRLQQLNKTYLIISPQKKEIDDLKEKIEKYKLLENMFSRLLSQRLVMSDNLNVISDVLTGGVWLSELSLSRNSIEIQGSCISPSAQELSQINKFLGALKENKKISQGLSSLELISVQRRKMGKFEVVDFVIAPKGADSR